MYAYVSAIFAHDFSDECMQTFIREAPQNICNEVGTAKVQQFLKGLTRVCFYFC